MIILLIGVVIFLMVAFPRIRLVLFNWIKCIRYLVVDTYNYIKYKKYNNYTGYGHITCYCADDDEVFGSGKTLSGVKKICDVYKMYNDKLVYDSEQKKFVKQKIKVLSNVHFYNIPYTKLENTKQIIELHNSLSSTDVAIVFIDEASTQFNSRNFKTNISSTLLNAMLTCRHRKFEMVLTAQRFNHVDALIRQITSTVYLCSKKWRLEVCKVCSAYDLEFATNPKYIEYSNKAYFVENWLYNAYDTNQIVEDIKRLQANGELLSDDEVLALQGSDNRIGQYSIQNGSRKFKKHMKGKWSNA